MAVPASKRFGRGPVVGGEVLEEQPRHFRLAEKDREPERCEAIGADPFTSRPLRMASRTKSSPRASRVRLPTQTA